MKIPTFYLPDFNRWQLANNGLSGASLNSTNLKIANIFIVPKSGALNSITVVLGSVTTAASLTVALYTVSLGLPTETIYGGCVTGIIENPVVGENEVNISGNVTVGDVVAIVISWTSTIGNLVVAYSGNSEFMIPYRAIFTTTWSKSQTTPFAWMKINGKYCVPEGCCPVAKASYVAIYENGSPDECGANFTMPETLRVTGVMATVRSLPTYTQNINLYVNNLLVRTATIYQQTVSNFGGKYFTSFDELTIQKGSNVKITLTAAVGGSFYKETLTINPDVIKEFFGMELSECSRTNGGEWSLSTSTISPMSLICSEVLDPPINRRTSTGR